MPFSIQIEHNASLHDEELEGILLASPDLEHLRIKSCPLLSSKSFESMKHLPIRFLEWIENPSTPPCGYLALHALKNTLLSLNVSGSLGFNEQACTALVQNCPYLQCLDASFCPLGPSSFQTVRAPLAFLNLEGCEHLTDQTLTDLTHIPTLKHLFLAHNPHITPNGIAAMQSLPLTTFSIRGKSAWKLSCNFV